MHRVDAHRPAHARFAAQAAHRAARNEIDISTIIKIKISLSPADFSTKCKLRRGAAA